MAPPTVRFSPGRYLAAFVVVVAALYGLVFFTGDGSPTPKLGIDLQGGTRVTLTARTETGAAPTPDQLNLARQIIDQRVNGLGVSGAEVVQDGNNLVITVPGQEGDQARSLGQTARLYFRPVLGGPIPSGPQPGQPGQPGATAPGAPGGPTGAGTPGQAPAGQSVPLDAVGQQQPPVPTPPPGGDPSATSQDPRLAQAIAEAKATRQSDDPAVQEQAALALDCAVEDPLRGYDDPGRPLVSCNREGTEKYLLGPAILSGTDVASAQPNPNPQGVGWIINLAFKGGQAANTWADYTSANVNNSNAVVLDSQVVSALRIVQPLLDGNAQISGNFNQASATDFANVLRYGSLPLSFDTSEAQTVSATLGLASLQAGLIAGIVGLALVFLYSLFYYRALGVLTILSLDPVRARRLRRPRAARAGHRLHPRPRRCRRLHRRHRHHGGLVRHLLRTDQGRGPRRAQLPVGGTPRMGPGQTHDPLRRRRELPRGRGALRPRRRPGEGLRVHAGHVHRPRPRRGVPRDAPAARPRVELAPVRQPRVVRPGRGGASCAAARRRSTTRGRPPPTRERDGDPRGLEPPGIPHPDGP